MASRKKNNSSSKLTVVFSLIIIGFLLFTINKQKETINKANMQNEASAAKIKELNEKIETIQQGKTLRLLEVEKKYETDLENVKAEVETLKNNIKELKEQNSAFDEDNAKLREDKQNLEKQLAEEKQKTLSAIEALNAQPKNTTLAN